MTIGERGHFRVITLLAWLAGDNDAIFHVLCNELGSKTITFVASTGAVSVST
jgi:hypothetical protein